MLVVNWDDVLPAREVSFDQSGGDGGFPALDSHLIPSERDHDIFIALDASFDKSTSGSRHNASHLN
jgi:hypothetical protein